MNETTQERLYLRRLMLDLQGSARSSLDFYRLGKVVGEGSFAQVSYTSKYILWKRYGDVRYIACVECKTRLSGTGMMHMCTGIKRKRGWNKKRKGVHFGGSVYDAVRLSGKTRKALCLDWHSNQAGTQKRMETCKW